MTRYFMRDTPLCQMEQQMMTPPNFKPRGHGLRDLHFTISLKMSIASTAQTTQRKIPARYVNALAWGNESRPGRSALRK